MGCSCSISEEALHFLTEALPSDHRAGLRPSVPSLPPPGNTGPFPTGYLKYYRPYLRLPREQTAEKRPLKVQPGNCARTCVIFTIFGTVTNLTGISKYLVSVLPASSLQTLSVGTEREHDVILNHGTLGARIPLKASMRVRPTPPYYLLSR